MSNTLKGILFLVEVFINVLKQEQQQATKKATAIDIEVYQLQEQRKEVVAGGDKARKIQEALSQIV